MFGIDKRAIISILMILFLATGMQAAPPTVTLNSPQSGTFGNNESVDINFTVSDPDDSGNLDVNVAAWHILNDSNTLIEDVNTVNKRGYIVVSATPLIYYNSLDSSPIGYHGVDANAFGADNNTDDYIIGSGSYDFNGNSWIESDNVATDLNNLTDFTISKWVKKIDASSGRKELIGYLRCNEGVICSAGAYLQWYWDDGDNRIEFGYRSNDGEHPGQLHTKNINDGQWHHVMYARDAGTTLEMCIDGHDCKTVADQKSGGIGVDTFFIGDDPADQHEGWFGNIDNFKIYNTYDLAAGWLDYNRSTACPDFNGSTSIPYQCSIDMNAAALGMIDGNHHLDLNARSAGDTIKTLSTGEIEFDGAKINYRDLNLFTPTDVTKNVDLNEDSDNNVVFDYSADIARGDFNNSSIEIYYHTTETGEDTNTHGFIRNLPQRGWIIESVAEGEISFIVNQIDSDTNDYTSVTENSHAYQRWSMNLDPEVLESTDSSFVLNDSQDWAEVLLTADKVALDGNTLKSIKFTGLKPTGNKIMTVYDCNQSVATPIGNSNCYTSLFDNLSERKEDFYFEVNNIIDDNNQISGVTQNSDLNSYLYFNCAACNAGTFWTLLTKNQSSNIDQTRNWNTTTGVGNLIAFTETFDARFKWNKREKTNTFEWYVKMKANNDDENHTTEIQRDQIETANLSPVINSIDSPKGNRGYSGATVDLNISAIDPNGDTIVADFNMLTAGGAFFAVITRGITCTAGECSTTFDSTAFADNNYLIQVIVRETSTDDKLFTSNQMTQNFIIDNTAPTGTIVIDAGSFVTNTTPDITLSASADVNEFQLSCNGTNWGASIAFVTSYSTFNVAQAGLGCTNTVDTNFSVHARFFDNTASNVSPTVTDASFLDRVKPNITVYVPVSDQNVTNKTMTFEADANDLQGIITCHGTIYENVLIQVFDGNLNYSGGCLKTFTGTRNKKYVMIWNLYDPARNKSSDQNTATYTIETRRVIGDMEAEIVKYKTDDMSSAFTALGAGIMKNIIGIISGIIIILLIVVLINAVRNR